jgi:SRSO17 transposase
MSTSVAWEHELQSWLEPFLTHLRHPARRRMCPLYVAGLIGPGERKSLQPMAARVAPADYDQLHHFVAVGRGTRHRWKPNSWPRPTGSSAGPTRSW